MSTIDVRAERNGEYTKLVWFINGKRKSRNAKGRNLSPREIERQRRELAAELAKDPRLARGTGQITVSAYIERYTANRSDLRDRTLKGQLVSLGLFDTAYGHRFMSEIATDDANDFRLSIEGRKVGGSKAAPPVSLSTVRYHMRNLRTFFRHAADELEVTGVRDNPFRSQAVAVPEAVRPWQDVSMATLEKLLDWCPSPQWRAMLALCRLAALRSNEAQRCKWAWFDDPAKPTRLLVAMPLDAHGRPMARSTKHKERVVPVSEKLRAVLAGVYELIGDTTTGPTDGLSSDPTVLSNSATGIRIRAGVPDYGQPLHALRKCQTSEWLNKDRLPLPTVAKWIGDRPEVVARYYHSVADADFTLITGAQSAPTLPQENTPAPESATIPESERWLSGSKQQT